MDFSEKIKTLRLNAGITQKQLSDHLGITASAIGYLENAQREPTGNTLIAYAKYFNVTMDFLVGLEPDDENSIFQNVQNSVFQLIPPVEQTLLNNFRKLPDDLKRRASGYMQRLAEVISEENGFPSKTKP